MSTTAAIVRCLDNVCPSTGRIICSGRLGFPNPTSLNRGEIDYVPTTLSIWGKQFVLIDELSRAAPTMQNKWLEVIRSRRIMGKRLPDLKFVFAAMNPPSYLGAYPLDEALAGRFAVVVTVPSVLEMQRAEIDSVIRNRMEDDAPQIERETSPAELKEPVTRLISDVHAAKTDDQRTAAAVAFTRLAALVTEGKLPLAPDDQYRVLERFRRLSSCKDLAVALSIIGKAAAREPSPFVAAPRGLFALRLALGMLDAGSVRDKEEAGKLAESIFSSLL